MIFTHKNGNVVFTTIAAITAYYDPLIESANRTFFTNVSTTPVESYDAYNNLYKTKQKLLRIFDSSVKTQKYLLKALSKSESLNELKEIGDAYAKLLQDDQEELSRRIVHMQETYSTVKARLKQQSDTP